MKILVTGATGLVGAEVVRQAILDDDIQQVTCLVRREGELKHPKVKYVIHKNFMDYSGIADVLKEQDACIWALGVSQTQVSKEEYHTITFDYAVNAGKALLAVNPRIIFLFVSGGGADTTEQSKTLFARVKGKTENELMRLPFQKLIIARPGGIRPIHKNKNAPFLYKLVIPLFPIMQFLTPAKVITSVDLALALLFLLKKGGPEKQLLENVALKKLVHSE
jgi:uncharacterized protein YbjT (DUF2867 family)